MAADTSVEFDFLIAGEALIDLIQRPDGCLEPKLGGSPWNLARALGRLGCAVAYRSPLSVDDYGQQLAQALSESHVQLTGHRSECPTSLALVKLDAQGHPDYAFYREGVADRDLDPLRLLDDAHPPAPVFHVGSLSLLPPDGHGWLAVLRALRQRGVVTSIDINMRPMVARDKSAYAALAREVLREGTVIKVSDEDLAAMQLSGDPLVAARQLLQDQTRVVVLTLGAHGAWCLTRNHEHFQAPAQVRVVDTVGAGDCFYAGFLAQLQHNGALARLPSIDPTPAEAADAMAFGQRVTAINLQRAGCQPPWRQEL